MSERPSLSPWGKIQNYKTYYPSVYGVITEGHGGIMVSEKTADELLSPAALKCGFKERGFICFEEDCQASVVIREMLDKNLLKIPAHFTEGKEKYNETINASLIRWNPEYWEETGNTLPADVLEKRFIERLKANLTDYVNSLLERRNEPDFLNFLASSEEIAAVNGAYAYLTKEHRFELSELQYLLQFQNPLIVVSDCWPRLNEIIDAQSIMNDICGKQDALHSGEYALVNGTTENKSHAVHDKPGKPSILEQVKENQEKTKKQNVNTDITKKDNVEI